MTGQLQFPIPVPGAVDAAAGETAKTAGMAEAATHTDTDWADACQAAIRLMAARGIEFQAADLIAEGLVDEPDNANRWGPQFSIAARAGVIRQAGFAPSKRATVHKSICKQWIGAAAGTEAAA